MFAEPRAPGGPSSPSFQHQPQMGPGPSEAGGLGGQVDHLEGPGEPLSTFFGTEVADLERFLDFCSQRGKLASRSGLDLQRPVLVPMTREVVFSRAGGGRRATHQFERRDTPCRPAAGGRRARPTSARARARVDRRAGGGHPGLGQTKAGARTRLWVSLIRRWYPAGDAGNLDAFDDLLHPTRSSTRRSASPQPAPSRRRQCGGTRWPCPTRHSGVLAHFLRFSRMMGA